MAKRPHTNGVSKNQHLERTNGTTTNHSNNPTNVISNDEQHPYVIRLSIPFLVLSIVTVAVLAYGVGHYAKQRLLQERLLHHAAGAASTLAGSGHLPSPNYLPGKEIPHTVYSGTHYDTGVATATSDLLARRKDMGLLPLNDASPKTKQSVQVTEDGQTTQEEEEEEADVHQPAGQHLLIDIQNVDGTFLNSAKRLAEAMIDLIELSGLTLLSYHCHTLEPVGVSCVGVLLESHISFHTWPIQGVITLDLFTCGEGSLLPLISVIETLFGVPRSTVEKPHMLWAHKNRGFKFGETHNPEEIDINQFLLGWMEFDLKRRLVEQETDYQTVQVYEVINSRFKSLESYEQSLLKDGNYFAQNKEIFRPDKIVYLDGIMQSRLFGETSYHEALVHPAMVAHPNPKRVAIIGGGEGATLREVLKHNTIETVTMIEIDEIMVQVSRQHIPEWSDCSNLVGSTASCFEDPRAEVYFRDAIGWFIEKFADRSKIKESEKYDVIIMDALDPSAVVEFSDVLYKNDDLVRSFYNALTDSGIFINQFGEAADAQAPGSQYANNQADSIFKANLQRVGFQYLDSYEEAHGGFLGIWSFIVAMKDRRTMSEWYANQASIDLKLRDRAAETVDGSFPFKYFDGASMSTYQFSSRIEEEKTCRTVPKPAGCDGHGFDPERKNAPVSSFIVKESEIQPSRRGLFSASSIEQGSYFALEEAVSAIFVEPTAYECIESFDGAKILGKWTMLSSFLNEFGAVTYAYGRKAFSFVPGLGVFVSHGCGGTQNVGRWRQRNDTVLEVSADPDVAPRPPVSLSAVDNTFFARNLMGSITAENVFLRQVEVGEELLDSDLVQFTPDGWKEQLLGVRAQCEAYYAGGEQTS